MVGTLLVPSRPASRAYIVSAFFFLFKMFYFVLNYRKLEILPMVVSIIESSVKHDKHAPSDACPGKFCAK